MTNHFWGIDVGGTNVKLGLLDDEGRIIVQDSVPTESAQGPDSLVERIGTTCEQLQQQAGINDQAVIAVGIGTPGPLSLEKGMIYRAGNLPGFDNYPLRGRISARLNRPAILDNDANVIGWGEHYQGAGKGFDNMVVLTLGTGVGGGIVYDGEILHGSEDNGAELGHMVIHPEGRKCNCGQNGCLEAYASATHMVRRAKEALDLGRDSKLKQSAAEGSLDTRAIFEHTHTGDELANEIVDGACKALAYASITLRHILEPRLIVLGGGVAKAGDILTERTEKYYLEELWQLKPDPMEFRLAQLGDNAGVVGGAGLAWHAWKNDRLAPIGI